MKKQKFIRLLTVFLSVSALVFDGHLALAAVQALPAPPLQSDLIGIAAAVHGSVELNRTGQVGHVIESGQGIYLNDVIKTGPEGHLQVLLLDETVFTLGPNSEMQLDEFVYDPATDNGKVRASVTKGVFRFITGKIAHKKPENMEVKLPSGTIGVRGTIVGGTVEGFHSLIVLFGPGEKHNTKHRYGSFVLKQDPDGKPEHQRRGTLVKRSEYGSEITGKGKAPSAAFRVPKIKLDQINHALTPARDRKKDPNAQPPAKNGGSDDQKKKDDNGKGPNKFRKQNDPALKKNGDDSRKPANGPPGAGPHDKGSDLAGQTKFGAEGNLKATGSIGQVIQRFFEGTREASQDFSDEVTRVQKGITSASDLSRIQTGVGHFQQLGVRLFNPSGELNGTYNFFFNVNFGDRSVGGGNSRVSGVINPTGGTGDNRFFEFQLENRDFPTFGPAVFKYDEISNTYTGLGTDCGSGCVGTVTVDLNNRDGQVAAFAGHQVQIYDDVSPSGNLIGEGASTTSDRQGGVV